MRVCIIGTGYVGLVTGACLAEIGHDVICIDQDQNKIARILLGDMPIYEPGLKELVDSNQRDKRLSFFSNVAEATKRGCEFYFIAVGTPTRSEDGGADLSHVYAAAEETALAIKSESRKNARFCVFVIKSTVPVGTGREVARLVGRRLNKNTFAVVSNPEFLREGCAVEDFMAPDRIIVGSKSDSARTRLKELYQPLVRQGRTPIITTTVETAELTKYAANAFLATKISFVNELSRLCEKIGADVEELALGMGLDKRIGDKFLKAGPGYGGSCFPKDNLALIKTANDFQSPVEIVETVVRVNNRHKHFMFNKVRDALGGTVSGKRIAVLGLAFKAGTDDVRDSPALTIVPLLRREGAIVIAYDPVASENAKAFLGNAAVHYAATLSDALKEVDAAVIITEWDEFRNADWRILALAMANPILIDFRNLFSIQEADSFGIKYMSLGRKPVAISRQHAGSMVVNYVSTGDDRSPFHAKGI
ncbi:MAG: UDP-glucose/GDP-mannose dehydrogenase family protein [Aestuariivirga sp.]